MPLLKVSEKVTLRENDFDSRNVFAPNGHLNNSSMQSETIDLALSHVALMIRNQPVKF